MRLVLVTRPDIAETNGLFRAAAAARGLAVSEIEAGAVAATGLPAEGRRLIYRPAVDRASELLEKLVARPGDALLHDPHFRCDHQPILLAKSGLPVARAVYAPARERERLEAQAGWLGGFPVVVKRPGFEGGRGISRAHDADDLAAQVAAAPGAFVEAFVPHVRGWRLTVLGGAVLAATATRPAAAEFRSNAAGAVRDPDAVLPDGAAAIAIAAVATLRLDFGGVDLMEGPDGALALAEVNFPCFFADQTEITGADIAGAIIDHLAAKASGA